METKITIKPSVHFTVQATLTEGDLRALDALTVYGINPFLEVFYSKMGRHYLEPYEKDLRGLFAKVETLRPALNEIDEARKQLKKVKYVDAEEIHS